MVTGANTGTGRELARMLYSKNAKVYIASRSQEKALSAIQDIQDSCPKSEGDVIFIPLDLNDLSTIKASAEKFLAAETELHVLFNNAGVQTNDLTKTVQGYEKHLGVNTIGPFLLTKLLTPAIVRAASKAPQDTVRVVWVSSSGTEIAGIKDTAVDMQNLDDHAPKPWLTAYGLSKAGNWLHAVEYARRHRVDGIVSVALNPGNLASDLYRDATGLFKYFVKAVTYPAINGAYTELFAGFSPEISLENTGCWVIPFGRIREIRKDLHNARKSEAEGGNGTARNFYDWTEEQVKLFV
ncbi:unnamed protein product [Periconia digitata]|uniref:Short-chain dehydrogenase n=1 Tax=Periconia digitata TaxID=1303443 RepID=A0A9W4URF6_9PLEO|nr:unnamed protein product [Periconia digitata]